MFFVIKLILSFGIINDVNRKFLYIYIYIYIYKNFHGQIEVIEFINQGKFVEKICC